MSEIELRVGEIVVPSPPPACRMFKDKLQWTMAHCRPPGRKDAWKQAEMVDLIGRGLNMFELRVELDDPEYTDFLEDPEASEWYSLSKSYLAALYHGRQRNPTLERITTLAAFFDIPPAIFVPRGFRRVAAQIELVNFVADHPEAYVLAQRGAQLSPNSRALLDAYLCLLEREPETPAGVEAAGRRVFEAQPDRPALEA